MNGRQSGSNLIFVVIKSGGRLERKVQYPFAKTPEAAFCTEIDVASDSHVEERRSATHIEKIIFVRVDPRVVTGTFEVLYPEIGRPGMLHWLVNNISIKEEPRFGRLVLFALIETCFCPAPQQNRRGQLIVHLRSPVALYPLVGKVDRMITLRVQRFHSQPVARVQLDLPGRLPGYLRQVLGTI